MLLSGNSMSDMEFLKSISDTEMKEAEIQKLFEKHLNDYEEGLKHVTSFLGTGIGIIDTLAIDDDFRPVIIEFKKLGNSERDALIQALHYYYWCSTHFDWLAQVMKKYRPDILKNEDLPSNDLRIMIVAGEFDDHTQGAVYSVEPDTQLVECDITLVGGKKAMIFKAIADSSRADRIVRQPKGLEDHFKGKETLRPLYDALKERILGLGSDAREGTPTQDYIPFIRNKAFCTVHVKKKWLRLDLRNIKDVVNDTVTPYPVGEWAYVHVEKKGDIDEIMDVVRKAYERTA